jgi:hypothetical protein
MLLYLYSLAERGKCQMGVVYMKLLFFIDFTLKLFIDECINMFISKFTDRFKYYIC